MYGGCIRGIAGREHSYEKNAVAEGLRGYWFVPVFQGLPLRTEYCQFLYKDRRRSVSFVQHATPDVLAAKKEEGYLTADHQHKKKKKEKRKERQGDTQNK
jgi:hypothetical protein